MRHRRGGLRRRSAVALGYQVTDPNHILPTAGEELEAHTASLALRVDGDGA